jgi:hypothetical protein
MQYRVNVSGSSETTWITTIAEGATVYLPVHVPRALLFIHDVQAMQGRWGIDRQCPGDLDGYRVHSRSGIR